MTSEQIQKALLLAGTAGSAGWRSLGDQLQPDVLPRSLLAGTAGSAGWRSLGHQVQRDVLPRSLLEESLP